MESKPISSSRFSTLRVFKVSGNSKPPLPVPKDAPGPYNITPYMTHVSSASTSALTLNTVPGSSQDLSLTPSRSIPSPNDYDPRLLYPHSPRALDAPTSGSPTRTSPQASGFKKGLFKFPGFGKGPKKSHHPGHIPHSPSVSALPDNSDKGISLPWNIQHHIHVNAELRGFPTSWSSSLANVGYGEDELAALRSRRRLPPPDDPKPAATIPHPYASAIPVVPAPAPTPNPPPAPTPNPPPALTSNPPPVPIVINPKPRSDSLRRNIMDIAPQNGIPSHNPLRRPPSPDISVISSLQAASVHTVNTDSSSKQSTSKSSVGSPTHSPTHSHAPSSGRSPPPAPLDLRVLRVVNEDPETTGPTSPPPAYVPPSSPSRAFMTENIDNKSRSSTEKPSPSQQSGPDSRPPEAKPEPEPELQMRPSEEAQSEVHQEDGTDEQPDQETAAEAGMSTLPPRLSLHTDKDDDWATLFSFMPLRESGAGPSSVAAKRRSKIFPAKPPTLTLDGSDSGSSPPPGAQSPESATTIYAPPKRASGIFTPDPKYPIANSPLWEEVRTLVKKTTGPKESKQEQTTSLAPPSPQPQSRFSDISAVSLEPELSSRFSDVTTYQGNSRFSEATSFQGHSRFSDMTTFGENSRFSDATSYRGQSRFSDVTVFSDSGSRRVSAWSVAGHHTPFTPMEPMPEIPATEKVSSVPPVPYQTLLKSSDRNREQESPPPREQESPSPPPPPPKEELPLPPQEDDDVHDPRASHASDMSSVLIHGPLTATRSIVPLVPAISISLSPRSSPSPSPLGGQPPPLPLPPGKVLPSLIMQERRRQRSDDGSDSLSPSSSYSRPPSNDSSPAMMTDSPRDISIPTSPTSEKPPMIEDGARLAHDDDEEPLVNVLKKQLQKSGSPGVNGKERVQSLKESQTFLTESPKVPDNPVTPTITVNGVTVGAGGADAAPRSPLEWDDDIKELPPVLAPLREYVYAQYDPIKYFLNLQEVAQGQYGSVYAAHVAEGGTDSVVAVKKVPIDANETPKIGQLRHELELMSHVRHKHILAIDGLFFDHGESTLWVRMELMERSLADVLELRGSGLELGEGVIARFAFDILLALAYLSDLGLAHRDVRSDNILIESEGVLKLADFSIAVQVTRQNPFCTDVVGVHHWQAPEIRSGRYDASLVDVWSLGATCWEMAESVPPFADIEDTRELTDRWPPLSGAATYSSAFHDFLRLCSEPPASRPPASQLLQHQFIQRASPRDDVLQVLHLCRQIEETFQ